MKIEDRMKFCEIALGLLNRFVQAGSPRLLQMNMRVGVKPMRLSDCPKVVEPMAHLCKEDIGSPAGVATTNFCRL